MTECWAAQLLGSEGCSHAPAFTLAAMEGHDLPTDERTICNNHIGAVVMALGVPCVVRFIE